MNKTTLGCVLAGQRRPFLLNLAEASHPVAPAHHALRYFVVGLTILLGLADTINFDIDATTDGGCNSVTGVCTIKPGSALPLLRDAVTINATKSGG